MKKKRLFFAFGIAALTLALPLCIKPSETTYALAEETPTSEVVEETPNDSTETEPNVESTETPVETPTEEQPTEAVPSEETPSETPSDTESSKSNPVWETINYYLQQAYVYIPILLSVITSIGLPSLVQICKIFASSKLMLGRFTKVFKKVNECVKAVDAAIELELSNATKDLEFYKAFRDTITNKKQLAVVNAHIVELETRCETLKGLDHINIIEANEISKETIKAEAKAKKKVKVKVVQG